MPRIITAKITRKHRPTPGASMVCYVTCTDCGGTRSVFFGGWTALVCHFCRAELYRFKKGAEKARSEAKRARAIIGEPGERRNGARLVWVTCGDCGAAQLSTYEDKYLGWGWEFLICRVCRVEMWRDHDNGGKECKRPDQD